MENPFKKTLKELMVFMIIFLVLNYIFIKTTMYKAFFIGIALFALNYLFKDKKQ